MRVKCPARMRLKCPAQMRLKRAARRMAVRGRNGRSLAVASRQAPEAMAATPARAPPLPGDAYVRASGSLMDACLLRGDMSGAVAAPSAG